MTELKRTIVVPCYNEAHRFSIEEYKYFLRKNSFFIIFVNDGSTDQTEKVLADLKQEFPSQVEIINLPHNSGKAEAVRQGMLQALKKSDQIAFSDADLSVSLTELETMFEKMNIYSFVFGSRIRTLNNNIERTLLRQYASRLFATLVSSVIGLPVYDSQCGVKIFNATLAKQVFAEEFYSRWLFDVEIFLRLKNLYSLKELQELAFEYPLVNWKEKGGSRLQVVDFFKAPYKLWQIRKKYK